MRLALLTERQFPTLIEDDRLLLAALRGHGHDPLPVVWDEPGLNWTGFDAVLIRSPWDYYHRLPRFLDVLGRIETAGVPLLNPLPVVRWNADKRYLFDLAEEGVTIPETVLIRRGSGSRLRAVLAGMTASEAVLKPAVSGGGFRTVRVAGSSTDADQTLLETVLADGDALVQALRPEIVRDGELSLVFIDGRYSHACRKRARQGEFRVQSEHGGTVKPAHPDGDLVAQAERVLAAAQRVLATQSVTLQNPLLYARVDGVVDDDGLFILMELELIEPELFFRVDGESAERFVTALEPRIST